MLAEKGQSILLQYQTRICSFYEKELGFNTLEVNFTYYQLLSHKTTLGMVEKTSDGFEFIVRSHKIWADPKKKKKKDNTQVFEHFKEGIKPMIESGKLGCVLIQFPSFFLGNQR
ncbi:MAG: DUF72 domain-containing protein [Thermodesulfobacteriota bacterium]|nr:DUF72 domain-containing protein [Thermodesulfobacteriota bacterium]